MTLPGLILPGIVFAQKTVVGYYPSWNQATYTHNDVQYRSVTHIAHAFIAAKPDGSLEVPSGFLYPMLNQTAHRNGVNVVVAVGGWGDYSARFSPMATDTAARHRFVANLTDFCITNNYDGADIDWEYPANASDRSNLLSLVRELRTAFNAYYPPLSISLAMPATGWSGQWFDVASMQSNVDWFGIMTYDFYGNWTAKSGPNSALYGNWSTNSEGWIDYSVGYYNSTRGLPAAKLLVGLPFYGWVFNASSMYGSSTGASQSTYNAIAPKLNQGWTRSWDTEGNVPYMVNQNQTQVISYDDSVSVGVKCDYVNSRNLGGAIVWAIGQDMISGRQPLLETVGAKLRVAVSVERLVAPTRPRAFELRQNYPNPFNGTTHISFAVPEDCEAKMTLYDCLGRELRTLADQQVGKGDYEVRVSSDDLRSGVYFYRLQLRTSTGESISLSRSLVLIR